MNNILNQSKNIKWKIWLFWGISIICPLYLIWHGPIAQDVAYHNFVDQRKIIGLNNFWNVVSNLFFIIVGYLGLHLFWKKREKDNLHFQVILFFAGIFLTGFGSAYYHFQPGNGSLVWDRLPMTIAFMSFTSLIIAEYINKRLGKTLLIPLLIFGAGSVAYWAITEQMGHGDLRFYILVQFLPLILFPITIFLFNSAQFKRKDMLIFFFFYLSAKLLEYFDNGVYTFGNIVSGHTLKHVLAALGTLWFIRMLGLSGFWGKN